MADWSILSNTLMQWVSSGLFWLIATAVITIAAFALLIFQKRTKLKYSVLEIVGFGNGKVGINQNKAGLFKSKSAFFNLWDYGNEKLFKMKDGRIIQCASRDDLHDIFGRKGFIVRTKDDDPRIVVPISRIDLKNENLLAEIAPADFRDASVNIINEAQKETQGWAEKYLPYIMLAGIVIFFIIAMILATQFFNRTVDKAGQILTEVSRNAGNVQPAPAGAP